jgi:hypothetical protein
MKKRTEVSRKRKNLGRMTAFSGVQCPMDTLLNESSIAFAMDIPPTTAITQKASRWASSAGNSLLKNASFSGGTSENQDGAHYETLSLRERETSSKPTSPSPIHRAYRPDGKLAERSQREPQLPIWSALPILPSSHSMDADSTTVKANRNLCIEHIKRRLQPHLRARTQVLVNQYEWGSPSVRLTAIRRLYYAVLHDEWSRNEANTG